MDTGFEYNPIAGQHQNEDVHGIPVKAGTSTRNYLGLQHNYDLSFLAKVSLKISS